MGTGSAKNNASIVVDSNFPGGNSVVESIEHENGIVSLHQDLHDTSARWFYWYFRVRGAEGRTITFKFINGKVIGKNGPAVSNDKGKSWRWLGERDVISDSFSYTFGNDERCVRFCFSIPYVESNLTDFLCRFLDNPFLRVGELCYTEQNRPIELMRFGSVEREPAFRVIFTARHHCCEMIANFVLEGIIATVLEGNSEEAIWLRNNVECMAVPFLDKDGVENGDQGKNRIPHDHNRDYDYERYASVRALKQTISMWSQNRLAIVFDLHCPYIDGDTIYLVGSPSGRIWYEQARFSKLLESGCNGPLPFAQSDNLPFGTSWNTSANFAQGKSFIQWAEEMSSVRLASTVEIPYASVKGTQMTPEAARAFGAVFADAIMRYLDSGEAARSDRETRK